jgi:hypothetical protein
VPVVAQDKAATQLSEQLSCHMAHAPRLVHGGFVCLFALIVSLL